MVISIDHGNRQIKTIHKTFVSGLVETDVRPALGEEFIQYNGHYYSLTERRLAYRRDKSRDESFFILTLFGISYEILAAGAYSTTEPVSIDLRVTKPVFVGGGSLLLRHYLEHSDKLGESLFVEDLHANAKGYERIHQAQRVHKRQS